MEELKQRRKIGWQWNLEEADVEAMRVRRNGVGDSSKGRKKTVAKVFEKITKRSSGEEEQRNHVALSVCGSFIIRFFLHSIHNTRKDYNQFIDHNLNNLNNLERFLDGDCSGDNIEMDYLLLPPTGKDRRIIDWECIASVLFSCEKFSEYHWNCPLSNGYAHSVQTKDGCVCIWMLLNSLVYTPHNGHVYCISGNLGLKGNSLLELWDGRSITYKKYYEERHGLKLCFDQESLLNRRSILQRCRKQEEKESSYTSVALPPELCSIIMSRISISTFYSFSFVPSIMHRLESLLIAVNLKKIHLDHCTQNEVIPTIKGFNRNESFDPKKWIIPGDRSRSYTPSEELLPNTRKIYVRECRKLKSKRVADVVEALINWCISYHGR